MTRILLVLFLVSVLLAGCGLMRDEITTVKYSDGCYFEIETIRNSKANEVEAEWKLNPPCEVATRQKAQ